MPGYISLMKFTPKALADLKGSPSRLTEAKTAAQKMGIKVLGVWRTMGEYDMVTYRDARRRSYPTELCAADEQRVVRLEKPSSA